MLTRSSFTWEPQKEKIKTKYGQTQTKTHLYPASSSELKTLSYIQNNVHDFAWFADKRFIVKHDTCKLGSGKIIDAYTFYTPTESELWKHSLHTVEDAIRTRSEWIGEYPYNVVSAVQGPDGFGGGMEYPTITLISPQSNEKFLEFTIAHEVGHNWFYGILGTNERQHPWMDEGINTFYDNRYSKWKYPNEGEIKFGTQSFAIKDAERLVFESKAVVKKDQPVNIEGDTFTNLNYDLVAYYKTGAWLELLEKKLGKETFDKAMQEYYRQWQFKHPYPEDFKKVLETVSGQNLDAEFALLDKKGVLPGMERKGTKIIFPYSPKAVASYIKEPSKNAVIISPLFGANKYDKLMIGGIVSNYKLPSSRFQFFVAPLYATGSKQLNGIGKLNYSFYPSTTFKKIDLFLNGSSFSMNSFEKDDGQIVTASFQKVVPGIRLTLNQKNARSNMSRYIQWKSFLINEESFRISYDSVFTPPDTIINQHVNLVSENRTLHQLKFVFENFRALYPYKAEFNIEHGKDFVRTAFTGNYFFNYPKEGGFDVRVFAGKFFYLGSKTYTKQFDTERYHLNMTGPNGYEDYTYSDYFIGRNKFDGFPSQQIMMRDGGFKIRTDLYSEKVGKTDDWLAAINLATTIPSKINPLSLLPVKIPLKVFVDIGTYGDAWNKDAELDHFIFDAGLQLSLFANTVNIYIPIIYSSVYKDYIQTVLEKEGRFWKTISFNIDISNFNIRKINRELDF